MTMRFDGFLQDFIASSLQLRSVWVD